MDKTKKAKPISSEKLVKGKKVAVAKKKSAVKTSSGKKEAKHPKGKKGVTISGEKYDLIRQSILSHIWRNEEIAFKQLIDDLEEKLTSSFDGSVSWYVTWVKMDLESKGIIEQVPGKKTQHLRLKQRIEKAED